MGLVTSATAARVFSSAHIKHIMHIIRVTFSETPPYAISCPLEYQMHRSTGVRLLGDACLHKAKENILCSWFVLEPKTHFCDCSCVGMTWTGMVMVMVLSAVLTNWLLWADLFCVCVVSGTQVHCWGRVRSGWVASLLLCWFPVTRYNVQRNVEARSCNHCCSWKTMNIMYSECVSVAFGVHHAKRMRLIILSSVARPALTVIFHIISWTARFSKNYLLNTKCVLRVSL